jgi:uncharacterized phosphatase
MTELYLLRHGETNANKNFIVQGRMDNPLNDKGIEQAFQTGVFLKSQNIKFDLVISSPLKRAYKTALLVNRGMLLCRPIILDRNLIERNFGDFDGKAITDDYYELTRKGQIPHMETDEQLEERVIDALKSIAESHPDKRLLIVTHSHVIKALLNKFVKDFTYSNYLHNCSINKIKYHNGEFEVLDYNLDPLKDKQKA